MTAMLPAHLTETLNNLGDAAVALSAEVRADREQRIVENELLVSRQRRQNRRVIALLVVVALAVTSLVLLSVANRRLGVANSKLNEQNAQIVEQIRSCTTAGGKCYEQSQRRTGDIGRTIILGGVYAQLCLRDNPDASDDVIEACVFERSAKAQAERSEPPPSGLDPSGKPLPDPSTTP